MDDRHNECRFIHFITSLVRSFANHTDACHQSNATFLRHRDVYRLYALPRMASSRVDWENHGNDDQGLTDSLEGCRLLCEADEHCIQYLLNAESRCLTSSRPNVGQAAANVTSG